jgi:hypothetical protein
MASRRGIRLGLAIAFVPVSSVLGLLRPMLEHGGDWFGKVWGANLFGDIVFTLGTVAAVLGTAGIMRRVAMVSAGSAPWTTLGVGVAASFILHWAVYAFAWSFTFGSIADSAAHPFLDFTFSMAGTQGNAWVFTFQQGWIGLLFAALAAPLATWWVSRMPGDGSGVQSSPDVRA